MQITFEAEAPAARAARRTVAKSSSSSTPAASAPSWNDGKVQKEGTHPIVYPAAGSHATFYDSAVYVENGQHGSGLGCDNTTGPLRELKLTPVLMPSGVVSKGDSPGPPTTAAGANAKRATTTARPDHRRRPVWREPFAWMAKQRTHQPAAARRHDRRSAGDEGVLRRGRDRLGNHQPRRRIAARGGGDGDRAGRPASSSSSASPGGARWTSTRSGGGAPSARSCARRASSTAATGRCSCPWRWRRWC